MNQPKYLYFILTLIEFIHLIASESNEICEKSNKKTISPEHVLEALKNLSFDGYIEDVESEYRDHQTQSKSKEKTKGSKLEQSGLSEEELLRQQEELFEKARIRMNCTANEHDGNDNNSSNNDDNISNNDDNSSNNISNNDSNNIENVMSEEA